MDTKQPEAFLLIEELEDAALGFHRIGSVNRCQSAKRALRAHIDTKDARISELEAIAAGYNAARLEIESLQAALAGYVQSGKDWASRMRELEAQLEAIVLCPDCGSKRCPKANHHLNGCTGSNEPGQPGSAYPAHGITAAQKGPAA